MGICCETREYKVLKDRFCFPPDTEVLLTRPTGKSWLGKTEKIFSPILFVVVRQRGEKRNPNSVTTSSYPGGD